MSTLLPISAKTPAGRPRGDGAETAQGLTPAQMARRMAGMEGLVWLDSSRPGEGALSMLTALPCEVLAGRMDTDWQRVEEELEAGQKAGLAGGLFGWAGFDGRFVLGVFPHALVYDHDRRCWFDSGGLAARIPAVAAAAGPVPRLDFSPQVRREDFLSQVRRAQELIAAGDIYQVNLAHSWQAAWPRGADALSAYQRLRRVSPAPHAAFLDLAGVTVLSASPELFLKMSGREIMTRPIKGTRPRFPGDPARDAASLSALLASEKERAELLMITDLERNDLGRVCEYGSVRVDGLWEVESFAQVFHLVSTVGGVMRPEVSHAAAFRACFPGGSITGAPKKRAMEIIQELEAAPRGLYTGAVGYFGFDGESRWSIAIRTAVREGERVTFHAGSGIVADSVPELEWEETLHKAAGLLAAWGLPR
ncbi:MAG TPA: anthranilate synthase component I family protein [Prosthecobacter sp.]|nr:anthranilate synthase component I family protein [Prosthecobacter sp.]HRK16929.1 anthranilate synthase component I family protein [Prosthecobacter sp.]